MHYLIAIVLLCACRARPNPEPTPLAANPLRSHALRSDARHVREGRVLQRLDAGPYSYFLLGEPHAAPQWFVSLRALMPPGPRVRALVVGRAQRFRSRRLGREFSPLWFAAVGSTAAQSSTASTQENRP